MRADRLLTLVTLLRQHDRLSAAALARRLEVTPRTVMRDVEALSAAGIPVYAERGRAGGYSLLPGYRPDVEQLEPEEARALFVAGGSSVASALGMQQDFDRALRKLATGLSPGHSQDVGRLLEHIVIDPGGWGGVPIAHPAAMPVVFQAVQDGRRLKISYVARQAAQARIRTIDPWGLVLAGATWYLIATHRGERRTYRVDRIQAAQALPAPATRPARIDLLSTWQELRAEWADQPSHRVVIRVQRRHADVAVRSIRIALLGAPQSHDDGPGHVLIEAQVSSLRGTVGMLLGFGDWLEVLEPPELRTMMVDVAHQALQVYGAGEGCTADPRLGSESGAGQGNVSRV